MIKIKFLLFFCLLACLAFGQRNYLFLNLGVGASSFSGYTLFPSLSYERNNNLFTLRYFYSSGLGHHVDELTKNSEDDKVVRYNNSFRDVSLLYGKTYYVKKTKLLFSIGPGTYKYTTRSLINLTDPNCSFQCWANYVVNKKDYCGLGLALQAEAQCFISQHCNLGINISSNINSNKSIVSASLVLAFDISTPELKNYKQPINK